MSIFSRRMAAGCLVVAIVSAVTLVLPAQVARSQEFGSARILAIDADPSGNTATSLGSIDSCISTTTGSDVTVDLIVDEVPSDHPIASYQIEILYDPEILDVTAVDNEQLLAAEGQYEGFEGLTDPLPDSDGNLTVSNLDLASEPITFDNMETGPGVISRITFSAKSAGTSSVTPNFNYPVFYPAILDTASNPLSYESIGPAVIVVDGECTPDIAPTPNQVPSLQHLEEEDANNTTAPVEETQDNGSSDTTVIVVAAVLAVVGAATVVGGLFVVRKRSRQG